MRGITLCLLALSLGCTGGSLSTGAPDASRAPDTSRDADSTDEDTSTGPDAPGATDVGSGDASPDASVDAGEVEPDAGGPVVVLRERKAFPTAQGYGASATGGRGGDVLYVTTTEDTGEEGSLRWALKQEGPRVVYFMVGGLFEMDSLMYVTSGDLTIAGETAHDLGGVHIGFSPEATDCRLYFAGIRNLIVRYISVEACWRDWEEGGDRRNPMSMPSVHQVIVDHYTGGWGSYTGGSISKINAEVGRGGMATTQRSLLHEGVAGHNVGGVGGIQMDYVRGSFEPDEHARMWAAWDGFSNHHNAFIGLTHRFFNTSGNGEVADQAYNNYVYGWNSRMSRHTNGNQPIDIYRNVYEAAPYNARVSFEYMHMFDHNDFYNLDPPVPVSPNFLIEENLVLDRAGEVFMAPSDDNWPMLRHFDDSPKGLQREGVSDATRRRTFTLQAADPDTLTPTLEVKDDVLSHCGAGVRYDADGVPTNVDPVEVRYLTWARDRTGPDFTSRSPGDGGLGDSSTFVFPDYPSQTRSPDTLDAEGVPLGWDLPSDVVNDAGYSRLELYLAQIAGDFHVLRR